VILASPIPGGIVKGNLISGNEFHGNGHGGVVMHAHAPGSDFSGKRDHLQPDRDQQRPHRRERPANHPASTWAASPRRA
jgi:hypothetical protein